MNKLIAFILCLFFCFSLAVSANALSYSDTQDLTNLLNSSGYQMSGFSNSDEETNLVMFNASSDRPFLDQLDYFIDGGEVDDVSYNDLNFLSITWEPTSVTLTDHIYLFLSKANATNMTFFVNGRQVTGNFTGYLNTYNGFYLTFSRQIVRDITVEFYNPNVTFNNIVGVLTAFTNSTISGRIDAGYLSAWEYLYDKYDTDPRTVKANLLLDVPIMYDDPYPDAYFEFTDTHNFHNGGTYDQFVLQQVRVHLTFDLYDEALLDNLDFATFTMMSAGYIPEFHAYVNDSAYEEGSSNVNVDCSLYASDFGEWVVNNQFTDYEAYGSTLFVDLRGVNVRNYRFLHIELAIDPISYQLEADDKMVFFKLLSADYNYSVSTDLTPTLILDTLSQILDQLGLYLHEFDDFFDMYMDHSYDLFNKLDSIIEALQPDQDQQSAVDQQGQEMQLQAGEVGLLNQTLDSVPKQNINVGDIIGSISTFDGNALTVMQSVTSNKYVIAILTVVFTLALLGYVLFGKR